MRIGAQYDFCSQRIDVRLFDERTRSALVTELRPVEEGHYIAPAISLDTCEAQQLMDQLWQCGLRPTDGTGSAGALAATQKHLDDMRRLVFDH